MLNKILKITAAAAFMVALAVNIDMMINDPFVGMSTEAIATDTDSSDTTCNNCQYRNADVFCIRITTCCTTTNGVTKCKLGMCTGNRLKCKTGTGTCSSTDCCTPCEGEEPV